MGFWLPLLLILASGYGIQAQVSTNVSIIVKGTAAVAETNDHFVCATIDWWPPEKCNYNQCPWGQSSILNLRENLTLAFLSGFLRTSITRFWLRPSKAPYAESHLVGDWNSSNARDFVEYTISKGYKVDSWEFGNELSGRGIGARVEAEQYGKDLVHFKAILDELSSGVVSAMTHHIYNLGPGQYMVLQLAGYTVLSPEAYMSCEEKVMACPNASSHVMAQDASSLVESISMSSNTESTQAPSMQSEVSHGPVAILWDIENCPVPSDVRPEDVAGNIRMALRVHPVIRGAVTMFSAFGDFNAFPVG
ncbi:hypothetical protein J5N97_015820 [Dioscorea zingiberensis]|uniref:Uncharacterized protein n=1 Tax=Dioscorea zingiberensis TaxID=325984 RepID=A0A9D5CKT2_9LILI|nr:hypothetical protein J5N97_015820 [Dioscorea zingiberensis]